MTQSTEQGTIWLTQEAYDKLRAELENLKGPVRQEVIERISSAREEQGKVEGRIRQLEDMLERAEVGETPKDDGTVSPGMKITYKFVGDADDEAETFLLGAREIEDSVDGLKVYSPQSPLGTAIIGARVGDTVSYAAPNDKTLEVVIVDATPYTG